MRLGRRALGFKVSATLGSDSSAVDDEDVDVWC